MNRLCKISEIESHSVLDQSEFGFLETVMRQKGGKIHTTACTCRSGTAASRGRVSNIHTSLGAYKKRSPDTF